MAENRNIRKFYDYLSKDYKNMPDYSDFEKTIQSPEKFDGLYNYLSKKYKNMPAREELANDLGISYSNSNSNFPYNPPVTGNESKIVQNEPDEIDAALARQRQEEIDAIENRKRANSGLFVSDEQEKIIRESANKSAKYLGFQFPDEGRTESVTTPKVPLRDTTPEYLTREPETFEEIYSFAENSWVENTEQGKNAYEELKNGIESTRRRILENLNEYIPENADNVDFGAIVAEQSKPYIDEYNRKLYEDNKQFIDSRTDKLNKRSIEQEIGSLKSEVERGKDYLMREADELDKKKNELENRIFALKLAGYREEAEQLRQQLPKPSDSYPIGEEIKKYIIAGNYVDDSDEIRNAAIHGDGFVKGLGRSLADPKTWDFGITEIMSNRAVSSAVEKFERGDELSQAEDALLRSASVQAATLYYYNNMLSRGYKAGQVTGQSIPFMLQFAVSGGAGAAGSVAKGLLKFGLKTFGTLGKNAAARVGTKALAHLIGSGVAAAGMSATLGAGQVAAGAQQRMLGDIKPDFTDKGVSFGGRENMQGAGEAILHSAYDNFTEYFSEMALSGGANALGTLAKSIPAFSKTVGKLSGTQLGTLAKSIRENPVYKQLVEKTAFDGYISEVGEEYLGSLLRSLTDETTLADEFTIDNQIDTWLGLAPTSIFFGAVGGVTSGYSARQNRKNIREFREQLGNDAKKQLFDKMMSEIKDISGAENYAKFVINNKELSKDEKEIYLRGIFERNKELFSDEVRAAMRGQDIEEIKQNVSKFVDEITNKETNSIIAVSVGNSDEELFVVKGLLNFVPDKSGKAVIDNKTSDAYVYVRNKDGEIIAVNTMDIDLKEVWNPENARDFISEQHISAYDAASLEGERVVVETPDGSIAGNVNGGAASENAHVSENGDVSVEVQMPDGSKDNVEMTAQDAERILKKSRRFSNKDGSQEIEVVDNNDNTSTLYYENSPLTVIKNPDIESYMQENGFSEVFDDVVKSEGEDIAQNVNIENEDMPTAFDRIPKDVQGQPIYEQAESPDLAWEAIVEQADGDEEMAAEVVSDIVKEKEAASRKAEKALKSLQTSGNRTKAGGLPMSMQERISAKKAEKEALAAALSEVDKAHDDLKKWEAILQTPKRRKIAEDSERRRIAEEQSAARRAEAERIRAEREEQERIEREALNGVPDIINDTPKDARARGYRRVNGYKVDRQEPLEPIRGKEVSVKFSDDSVVPGHVAIIDAEQLQPSHLKGQRNPLHFIDEAQPKERKDDASVMSAEKIAGNIRPEEITSSVTAYTGAPTVNVRGEIIQGNNRGAALRAMWDGHPDQAEKYKQYLIDHSAEFGLNAEDVSAMDRPVLVNVANVSDDTAITLGQYVAQDTESEGVERIKPKNIVQKMGNDMSNFASQLLASSDEEMSFPELVDRNGLGVLKWIMQKGYISPTQYKSAFDSKGNLTAEAKNDLKGIMYQGIFSGGSTQLEEMFNELPAKAQKAILATAYRDYDSPASDRIVGEIQSSIMAFHALLQDASFDASRSWQEARVALEDWKRQYQLDDVTGESFLPSEKFSNFALHLAAMYKVENQSYMQGKFNKLYDLIQGTQEETLFDAPDNTPRTLSEAIKEVFNIDYNGGKSRLSVSGMAGYGSTGKERRSGGDNVPGRSIPGIDRKSEPEGGLSVVSGEKAVEGGVQGGVRQGDGVDAEVGGGGKERIAGKERDGLRNNDRRGIEIRTDARKGDLAQIGETDQNGYPFVLNSDGEIVFGEIGEDTGLTPAPILLSKGYQDENGKGYGLAHIEANHGEQIRNAGFSSVEDFVSFVARNYDKDNIRVGKRRAGGNTTYLLQVTDTHDNTLFIEMSKGGTYWNVNSAGIFRKGYSNKKETVAKTEPQQPNNAVSIGSSLSENEVGGIISSEPNGKPTVSESKDSESSATGNSSGKKNVLHGTDADAVLSRNEPSGIDAEIDAARNGDKAAQRDLDLYGIPWQHRNVYRHVGQSEVDELRSSGKIKSRRIGGKIDVTASELPTTSASSGYRVKLKMDFDKEKSDGNRAVMKNGQLADGWITDGQYTLDEVESIERRNEDGSYTEIYKDNKWTDESNVTDIQPESLPVEEKSVSSQKISYNDTSYEVSEPISQGEHRAVFERDGGLEQTANRPDSRIRKSEENARRLRTAIEGKNRAEAGRIAEEWAKSNGLWTDYSLLSDFGVPFQSGNENDNYLSGDGYVYKVNNLMNSRGDLQTYLDGVELHNRLFPNSAYEFVGLSGFGNGSVYPVFRQQYVQNARLASPDEIDSYIRSLGFEPTGNEAEYGNGEIVVSDLRPRNVLKSENGNIYVVDAELKVRGEKSVESAFDNTRNKRKNAASAEKIEDVGEKIGGARKDRIKEYSEKIKDIEKDNSDILSDIAKLPLSKVYNFDYAALREEGVPNEVVTLIETMKKFIPSKPRTEYKLRRWVSNVFSLYTMALRLVAADGSTQQDWVNRALEISGVKRKYDAYMALGGFDGKADTADAELQQLDDTAGHYGSDGAWVSAEGKWYVSKAGKYGGIYDTKEEAVQALRNFSSPESTKVEKKIAFSVYTSRKDGKSFITIKGKPSIVIQTGFDTAKQAIDYVNNNYNDLVSKYSRMKEKTEVSFKDNREREGKDWRSGKDVTADEFMNTFGFRGVEFGNWTNQSERQNALNRAFDALMDLSEAIGKSPSSLSLNGELAIAFGARGGGKAAAHYEPGRTVINLTKTQGAGSLAHEWWHAVDNYFAKRRGEKNGFNTEREGYKYDRERKDFSSDKERKEITDAFKKLVHDINASDYGKRSSMYASLKSSYWKEPTELGARAFASWVERKLSEKGIVNDYLSNNPIPTGFEEYVDSFYPYPIESDFDILEGSFDNLFNAIQEKVDEETGNVVLFNIAPVSESTMTESQQLAFDAVSEMLNKAGIPVEVMSDEEMGRLAGLEDASFEAKRKSESRQKRDEVNQTIDKAVSYVTGKGIGEVRSERMRMEQARRDAAKEIYDSVLRNDFNSVVLQQINDYIDDATPKNPYGRRISQRVPQAMERSLHEGNRTNAVDALFTRISESSVGNAGAKLAGDRSSRESAKAKKKELLKGWAIATGNWHTDIHDFTNDIEPIASGKDSDVYYSKDGRFVIKFSRGKDGKRFTSDIDAANLFGFVFPNTAYDIVGYGEINGEFVTILRQPVVDIESALTEGERVEYMRSLGYHPINKENTAFSNGEIVVSDLQKGNIVRGLDGNIYVIDADVKLHTRDMGGNYTYPPASVDTEDRLTSRPQLMTVYHGSGAEFDAFDHSHMGEGEGAQAYGWGSYVTEVEGIGRAYAESTSGNIFRSGFGDFYLSEIRKGLAQGKRFDDIKQSLLAHHAEMYKKAGGNTDMYGDFITDYETLQQLKESDLPQRNLYTVEIPDNTGENYLDWEKPMSDNQAKIIENAAKQEFENEMADKIMRPVVKGNDFNRVYAILSDKSRLGSDKAASEFLSRAGFIGISYPAQYTTGGRSDNARNYVIFNEEDLQIKDRISFMKGKKKASETVLPEDESSFKGTVVSDADGTKVLNNLDNVAKEYDKFSKNRPWTFLGDVAKALGARQHGSKSQYATFETVNGQVVTIRLSDHNASTRNFDNAGRENGISIVISRKPNQGITNDGNARLVEFFYPDKALQKAEGKPLAEIVRSIKQALYSGEYTDTTGLAEIQEVNADQQEVRGGVVYGATVGGKIYMNGSALNPETPIHEYTHIWDIACQKNNPELWNRGVELMRQTPIWDEVKNDPNYSDLKTDDEIASEVHSRLTGKDGTRILEDMAEQVKKDGTFYEIAKTNALISKLKKWLSDFWYWLKDTMAPWTKDEAQRVSLEDFINMPLKDLARGTDLRGNGMTAEEIRIIEEAKSDGTYMKAPNGNPTNLTERQWAQVRTKAFKEWFGDWEKSARIEKLRESKPLEVNYNGEYELDRKSAKEWLRENVRGEYTNADTGDKIGISRVGINEVTSHGSQDEAHLKSLICIPQMIEHSVFIDEISNSKDNDKYDSYRYYVCGLKIDGMDYTAKIVVGVKGDRKYYDHRLTEIEKGKLIDNLNGLSNSVAENQNAPISVGKDTKLVSLLQTNSSKVVDENGEPAMVQHWTPNEFTVFDVNRLGSNSGDDGVYGNGFYFGKPMEKSIYGDKKISAFLDLKNPLYIPKHARGEQYRDSIIRMFDKKEMRELTVHDSVSGREYSMGEYIDAVNNIRDGLASGRFNDQIKETSRLYGSNAEAEIFSRELAKRGMYETGVENLIFDIGRKDFTEALKRSGYDGVITDAQNREYVAFDSTQVKSATGNIGDFDASKPDIRFRISEPYNPKTETISEFASRVENEFNGYDRERIAELQSEIAKESEKASNAFNSALKTMYDIARPLEKFQDMFAKQGALLDDRTDAYSDFFRSKARVSTALNEFEREKMKPIYSAISSLTRSEKLDNINDIEMLGGDKINDARKITLYLQAKDIVEAKEKGLVDRGEEGFSEKIRHSDGVTKYLPEEYVYLFESNAGDEMVADLWSAVRNATKWIMDYQLEYGFVSQEKYDELMERQYYVPQRGFEEDEEQEREMEKRKAGQSSSVFNSALKKAKGRKTLADDPIPYIFSIAQSTAFSVEKNRTKQKAYNFVMANLRYGLHTGEFYVDDVHYEKTIVDGNLMYKPVYGYIPLKELFDDMSKRRELKGLQERLSKTENDEDAQYIREEIERLENEIRYESNVAEDLIIPSSKENQDEHRVRVVINGRSRSIYFKNKDVAAVLNRSFSSDYMSFTESAKMSTSYMSRIYTQLSPAFSILNLLRDYPTAIISNIAEGYGQEFVVDFLKNTAKTMPTISRYVFSGKMDGKYGEYLSEFFKEGAQTGYSYMFSIEKIRSRIEREMQGKGEMSNLNPLKLISSLGEFSELVSRFTQYVTAREHGYSAERAATMAKEITVNFDRRGNLPFFYSYISFFNATMQGTYKFVKLLAKNKTSRRVLISTMSLYMVSGFLDTLLSPDDPDDEKSWTDWDRMQNFIIGSWKIPIPPFFRAFWAIGVQGALAYKGKKTSKNALFDAVSYFTGEMLPLNPFDFLQFDSKKNMADIDVAMGIRQFVPTVASPVYDVVTNRTFTGGQIHKEPYVRSLDDITPQTTLARNNVNPALKWFTDYLYELGGGNLDSKRPTLVTKSGDVVSPMLDINPSDIQHLVSGYFGGLGTFVSDLYAMGCMMLDTAFGDGENTFDDFTTTIPVINRLYKPYDIDKPFNASYWELKGRVEYIDKLKSSKGGLMHIPKHRIKLYNEAKIFLGNTDYKNPKKSDLKKLDKILEEWNKTYWKK